MNTMPEELKRVNALMLDLDGTLVHSAPDIMRVLNETLANHGRDPVDLEAVMTMIGDGIPSLIHKGLEATGGLESQEQLDLAIKFCLQSYSDNPVVDSRLYDNVESTLQILGENRITLAVCTNKAEAIAKSVLQNLGIAHHFKAIVGGDTLAVKKPDKDHLLYSIDKMGSDPSRVAMVGDSSNDIVAANNAGVPAILVSFGYNNSASIADLSYDWVIDDFSELLNIVSLVNR